MFDSPDFDVAPYQDFDMPTYVRRTYCSWDDAGWQSLLVQRFDHVDEADSLVLPAVSDVHLVLCVAGDTVMRINAARRRWVPGSLALMVPGQESVLSYQSTSAMRTVQVHIPSAAVSQASAQLGGPEPDFEALAAGLYAGDPVVEQVLRALPAAVAVNDLYAESAAAFLATHLVTRRGLPAPRPEPAAVRVGTAIMRERLAEPLSLADIAAEVHLSVYHFVRVFRSHTGETPYRFLTRLRIEHAQFLLSSTALTIAQIASRCGFSSPGALSTAFLSHVGIRPSTYRKI